MSLDNPEIGAVWAHRTLRLGTALAFLYPPIAALGDPLTWAAYFPHFVRVIPIDTVILLHLFGVVEVVIAVWILSGKKIRIPAALATLMLVGIVVFNLSQFDVLFRDLSIAAMTLALVFWPIPHSPTSGRATPAA